MNLQNTLNNPFIFNFVLLLAKSISPRAAKWLIPHFARLSVQGYFQREQIQAMAANQWVIHQGRLQPEELKNLVQRTVIHRLHFLYDLYHHGKDPQKLKGMITLNPQAAAYLQKPYAALLVGPHIGNFDLMGWFLAQYLPQIQVITVANPNQNYQMENRLRREMGLDITPASLSALRQATQRLRAGQPVVTGIDRPFAGASSTPHFFGRPAALPLVHIHLALNTGVPVILLALLQQPDGLYHLQFSPPFTMQPYPDHATEVVRNAERILQAAEEVILLAPDQWEMFFPIWPEVLNEIPEFRSGTQP